MLLLLYTRVWINFGLCDKSDNVIDQANENDIEGENLDKANVSDKQKGDIADVENNVSKEKMDEGRDEGSEKMEDFRDGNIKGNLYILSFTYVSRMFILWIFIIRREMCSG